MKRFVQLLITTGLLLLAPATQATVAKVSSYELNIEFLPQKNQMQGQATMTFPAPLESGTLTFYLHGELEVESISLNSQELEFETEQVFYDSSYALIADKVSFELVEDVANAELTVSYRGYFHPSAARSPSDYMRIDAGGVFLRAYHYSLWFPVFLADNEDVYKADFTHVRFRIPRQYQLVFIGQKVSEEHSVDHTISTWTVENVKLSDLQVTAQKYETLEFENISIFHYDNTESREAAQAVADFTQKLLDYYQAHYRQDAGVDKLNLLEMPEYGDISSHNMVGVSSETFRSFDTAIYAKRTIAHELVHPFVSTQVNRSDPLWVLATEGFPSYFHLPALRQLYGEAFYDEFILKVEGYYLQNKGVKQDRWGNTRPPEVALLNITAASMSEYKDDYILWGRTKLFFNYLLEQMGEETFSAFAAELFSRSELAEETFVSLCRKYLPNKAPQIQAWLYSNEFPDEFRITGPQ